MKGSTDRRAIVTINSGMVDKNGLIIERVCTKADTLTGK
jgi:hypothetical protein